MIEETYASTKHDRIDGYTHISLAVDETNKKLQDIRDGKVKPIYTSSKKENEKIGGFFPTDQITIAARTGTGKSAVVLNMVQDFVNPKINPLHANNMLVLYDSWEMPMWRNMLRMYSKEGEIPVKQILDYQNQMQLDAFQRIMSLSQKFKGYPIYFRTISQTVKDWADTKRRIRDLHKDKIIVNIVDHTRLITKGNEQSEEALITNFMFTGMKLKLELDTVNIFLTQMNRNIESSSIRSDIGKTLPVSSDIFGADSVYQSSDVVLAYHRPGFYGLTDWNGIPTGIVKNNPEANDFLMIECVLKQRDGWTGNLTRRHNLAINKIEDYEI